jgi:predicted KAP-like P-loop ATPase
MGCGSRDSSPLRLWSDNPTSVDLLGFGDIAAPILEAIRRERLDPVAVGIFGDWGSGKTTVLEILDEALRPVEDTIVVYTRPWEYDPTLDARATLITEVLDALRTRAKKALVEGEPVELMNELAYPIPLAVIAELF